MKQDHLVSIIIPTRNAESFIQNCLIAISKQSYKNYEVLVIDGKSTDKTVEIAQKHHATVLTYVPNVEQGTFDAPHKRNYGAKKAKGDFVYYLDADMELTKNVLKEAVSLCSMNCDGVILPEESFGIGPWAQAKNLERRCYWGDDSKEAPRFFKKKVWEALGGLDVSLGGGGDDWDLYQKMLDKGYIVGRIKSHVMHNEGDLRLGKLMRKRFMYGRDSLRYVTKRPKAGFLSYFPIQKCYIRNWKMFLKRPKDSFTFIIMRTAEYCAGFSGIVYSFINR